MKRLAIRTCEKCGGNYHVDPQTEERAAIYMGAKPCVCGEDANQSAFRIVKEATEDR